jgi:excisionase family DNA binding protein
MQTEKNTQPLGQEPACQQTPALIGIEGVARILGCSSRHVRRMIDSRRMPRPIKLGSLTRWTRSEIDTWLSSGCPACNKGAR